MHGNYYMVLGISPDANLSQIRRAFRQRAHECHPDHDPQGTQQFQQVKQAYDTLSNPSEKARYDRQLRPRRRAVRHVSPEVVDLLHSFGTYSPSLGEVTNLFAQNFIHARQPKTMHVRDLNLEMVISPEEATSGGHLAIGVPIFEPCSTCQGTGKAGFYRCDDCAGRGTEEITARVDVLIPRGTTDGTTIPVSMRHLGIHNMNLLLHIRLA